MDLHGVCKRPLMKDRGAITGGLKEALMSITDNAILEKERDALQNECEVVMQLMKKAVQENARVPLDQESYKAKESGMVERYNKASHRLAEVTKEIAEPNANRSELQSFLKQLDKRDTLLTEFDESLWLGLVHLMRVDSDGGFTFVLKDCSEVVWVPNKTHSFELSKK